MATSKRLLIALACLLCSTRVWAQMPPLSTTVVGTTSVNATTVSTASLTVSGALNNAYLLCGVATNGFSTVPTVTSVTFAGSNLTFQDFSSFTSSGSVSARAEFWSMLAPPAATSVVTASLSSSTRGSIGCLLYSDVDQTTPYGTLVKSGGRTASPQAIVAGTTSQVIVDIVSVHMNSGTATAGAGQTQLVQQLSTTGTSDVALLMSREDGATSVTMSWHMDDSSNRSWANIGIPLTYSAGGGGGTPVKRAMTLGVGDEHELDR